MTSDLGFKALAYPAHTPLDHISPCRCSLVFKSTPRSATMLLVVQTSTPDDLGPFVIQYDADNLSPGHNKLTSGNTALKPHTDGILRFKHDNRPQIKTLTLSVQHVVPVWCRPPQNSAREPGSIPFYGQVVELARATAICIVFDYKFLSQEHQSPFKAFSKASKDLTGYPVKQFLLDRGLRETDWTHLSPVDHVGAPPAYGTPCKRPREAVSTPPSPPRKRSTPQSPTNLNTSDATAPNSPRTAEAISAPFLRKAAIGATPREPLSACLQKDLAHPSSSCSIPDSELDKLHAALRLLGSSPPSSPPEPPMLTLRGQSLVTQLRTLLANDFQRQQDRQFRRFEELFNRLSDAAEDMRAHETAEVEEYLEEHKIDLRLEKDDCLKELSADVDALYAKGRQECLDIHEELTQMLEDTFGEMCNRIEAIKRFELKKMVAAEVKKQERQRRGVQRGVNKKFVKSDRKLLGRRREDEWVDC